MTAPVVLVPGLGLGPESYAPTLRYLEVPYEVVTLPGYGARASHHDDLHTEVLSEQLTERLGALQEPAVLVGHSASCQIVVAAALNHPQLVKALVLAAPSGDVRASSWSTLASRWLRSAVWDPPRHIPTLTRQYFRTSFGTMARAMDAARHYDLAAAMPGLKVPTVVLRSKHDRICPPGWTQELGDLAHGEAWTLPTGSHLPGLTNGRELAAFIQRYAGVYKTG
jgi:pimeloyl-ACP methyl ester carboxylesterase